MGLIFKILCEPWEIWKILCAFAAKLQKMDTFFQKNPWIWVPSFGKITLNMVIGLELPGALNMVMGLELPAAHPRQIQILVTPPL